MELRTHAHIIKQARWFIVLFTLCAAASGFAWSVARPSPYQAVIGFDVFLVNRPAVKEYQYGAYYDLKAAELFGQTVMSWFLAPAVVKEMYDEAGVGYTIESVTAFTDRFRAKQYSPQHFVVLFRSPDRESAEQLSRGIITVVERRAAQAGRVNDQSVFQVTGLEPIVTIAQLNIFFATVVGGIAGLLLSLMFIYLREYFRN